MPHPLPRSTRFRRAPAPALALVRLRAPKQIETLVCCLTPRRVWIPMRWCEVWVLSRCHRALIRRRPIRLPRNCVSLLLLFLWTIFLSLILFLIHVLCVSAHTTVCACFLSLLPSSCAEFYVICYYLCSRSCFVCNTASDAQDCEKNPPLFPYALQDLD